MNKDKYYKYQMTFPFEGNKIYKSKSLSKVVKKCYKDYKKFSDINEGLFCVTNIDKDIEYRFQVKNHKIIIYPAKAKWEFDQVVVKKVSIINHYNIS